MATYAIGDIQGCLSPLQQLLEQMEFNAQRDRLWLVGDLVNRGPQSLETLRFVRNLGDVVTVVLGNHDLHLITLAAGFGRARDDDTLAEVLNAPDAGELVAWLRSRSMFHVEAEYAMVHAGLLPQWDIARASELGNEVQSALRGPQHIELARNMYGSKPDYWTDELSGWDRLRVIINAMTRMRICDAAGRMEFQFKGERSRIPQGYMPWFEIPGRKSANVTVICGHWSALGLHLTPNLLALDSGCLWGRQLSAIRLEDRKLFQVNCPRQAV